MKKVLTVGVFDYLHIGHVKLFERAKQCGDYLIVAVQDSDIVHKYKPDSQLLYSMEERMYMVNAIKYVDEVIRYRAIDEIVKEVDFNVLVTGVDQNHEGFQKAIEWCKTHDKETCILSRTEGISSSLIKAIVSDV